MVHKEILLSLFLVTGLLAGTTIAKTDLISFVCSTGENFTKTSLFQQNLERALSINTTDINYGFYNFSGGRNSDRVDVIGLCRGDVNGRDCRSCLVDSGQNLRQQCPNQKEAIWWANKCMIRYANRSILHMNQTSPSIFLWNVNNASDPTLFNKVVRGLLDNLRAKAAAGGSRLKYAIGHTNSTRSSEKIYGLVQCTPDLSPVQCSNCLNGTFEFLPQCCDGKIGGRVLGPSCNFRYEINRFYGQNTPPGAPAPQAAPSPQAVASPPEEADASPPEEADASPPEAAAPPPQADASPPEEADAPPASSTPKGLQPPLPPQGGGGNRNLGFFGLSMMMAALPPILIF